jgi:FKBP-type peptidyl-prolyl cis-trans isomerase SlpA
MQTIIFCQDNALLIIRILLITGCINIPSIYQSTDFGLITNSPFSPVFAKSKEKRVSVWYSNSKFHDIVKPVVPGEHTPHDRCFFNKKYIGATYMNSIEEKDTVSITYTGKLDNGEVFTTIDEQNPLIITLGNSDAPPTLEQALLGMAVGDTKRVRLPPEEGFGPRRKELLHTVNRKTFGNKINPSPGMILSLNIERDGTEHKVPATVVEVSGDTVVVDYNHPLAGHHLTYDLTVTAINKYSERSEIKQ